MSCLGKILMALAENTHALPILHFNVHAGYYTSMVLFSKNEMRWCGLVTSGAEAVRDLECHCRDPISAFSAGNTGCSHEGDRQNGTSLSMGVQLPTPPIEAILHIVRYLQ